MSARTTVPGLLVVAKAAARAGADVLARRWTGHHPAVPLGIEEIGAPEARSAGFWNNHGQCCGDAGVGVGRRRDLTQI